MKIEREPVNVFVPVIVTLETQEEVDAIFALFNHRKVSEAVLNDVFGEDAYRKFEPHATRDGWRSHHAELLKICK